MGKGRKQEVPFETQSDLPLEESYNPSKERFCGQIVCIFFMILLLITGVFLAVGCGLWALIATRNIQYIVGDDYRAVIIGFIIISATQIITISVGVFALLKRHICLITLYCVLTFAVAICLFVINTYIFVERNSFINVISNRISQGNPDNYPDIDSTFGCELSQNLTATTLEECSKEAKRWVDLSLWIIFGCGTYQILILSFVLLSTCLLHKFILRSRRFTERRRRHEIRRPRRRIFKQRNSIVVPLDEREWSRESVIPNAPPMPRRLTDVPLTRPRYVLRHSNTLIDSLYDIF